MDIVGMTLAITKMPWLTITKVFHMVFQFLQSKLAPNRSIRVSFSERGPNSWKMQMAFVKDTLKQERQSWYYTDKWIMRIVCRLRNKGDCILIVGVVVGSHSIHICHDLCSWHKVDLNLSLS